MGHTPIQTVEQKAKEWATQRHAATNHLYDGKPYETHLSIVVDFANKFIAHIPAGDREHLLAACWLHDTIEDCRVTYNEIKQDFGEEIAELVYALTNEKGRNRKERANDKYYQGIRDTQNAPFIKICDRLANAQYSFDNNAPMMSTYQKEHAHFRSAVDDANTYSDMWEYMDTLLK